MSEDWFKNWFNTKYYHILYKGRDYSEAELFIDRLVDFLSPSESDRFLDAACGKGRHSIYLNKKGFFVDGFDLSEESIEDANKNSNDRLHFYVHDMRQLFRTNYYDFVLNLFTSFGYFKSDREEVNVLKMMRHALKPKGKVVIDFLNKEKVLDTLIPYEEKEIEGVLFKISKEHIKGHVVKKIVFSDEGKEYQFQESVKLLSRNDFERLGKAAGLRFNQVFGDYNLGAFKNESDRLILIGEAFG